MSATENTPDLTLNSSVPAVSMLKLPSPPAQQPGKQKTSLAMQATVGSLLEPQLKESTLRCNIANLKLDGVASAFAFSVRIGRGSSGAKDFSHF